MRGRETGYSLVELLAVVLVLSVAATIAVPNFATSDPNELELAAQEFARAMRHARSEAIRGGAPHGFRHESTDRRIRVFRPDTGATPWVPIYDVVHPISKKLYDIDLSAHAFARADTMAHSGVYRGVCNDVRNVYFDGRGVPRCTDPETVLLESFDVTLTHGVHTRTVTLDGITGRVIVQ